MGAYLTHPSIKAEAKAGKQVHDSFFKFITLTYLLIPSSLFDALPQHPILQISSNGGLGNEAPNGTVIGGCPYLSPQSCDATTGRGGQLGGAATGEPTLAFGYLLQRRWGVDDVVMLVEQLDMATFALSEESQEADRLHLFVATAK